MLETLIKLSGKGGGGQQKGSVTIFSAYMYNCLVAHLGPEAFRISNNMLHASNPNYSYNVKLSEKIHLQILSMNREREREGDTDFLNNLSLFPCLLIRRGFHGQENYH